MKQIQITDEEILDCQYPRDQVLRLARDKGAPIVEGGYLIPKFRATKKVVFNQDILGAFWTVSWLEDA